MTKEEIKEILEKQLQLLSKDSESLSGDELCNAAKAITGVVVALTSVFPSAFQY